MNGQGRASGSLTTLIWQALTTEVFRLAGLPPWANTCVILSVPGTAFYLPFIAQQWSCRASFLPAHGWKRRRRRLPRCARGRRLPGRRPLLTHKSILNVVGVENCLVSRTLITSDVTLASRCVP